MKIDTKFTCCESRIALLERCPESMEREHYMHSFVHGTIVAKNVCPFWRGVLYRECPLTECNNSSIY